MWHKRLASSPNARCDGRRAFTTKTTFDRGSGRGLFERRSRSRHLLAARRQPHPSPERALTSVARLISGRDPPAGRAIGPRPLGLGSRQSAAFDTEGSSGRCRYEPVPTVTVKLVLAERPAPSVTVAVTVCVPWLSVVRVKVPPVPSAPSRLEAQTSRAVTSPSSGSEADAANVTGAPKAYIAPSEGAVRVRTGGAGSTTSIVTEAAAVSPPVSVAAAVMVWRPA